MFTTVRYFIKSSIFFLLIGVATGIGMSVASSMYNVGIPQEIISAHTHIILVGSVMMMIMGVALWFFPRAEKEDKRYNPDRILVIFWLMAISTGARFALQVTDAFLDQPILRVLATAAAMAQGLGMLFYFYSVWGRIRAVGSQYREAKGEKF